MRSTVFLCLSIAVFISACNSSEKGESNSEGPVVIVDSGKTHNHYMATEANARVYADTFPASYDPADMVYEGEKHLKNIQQLTYIGDNAEAYWSFDGSKLVFQRTCETDGFSCDQIFSGSIPEPGQPMQFSMLSTGMGRTTCSYFLPGDSTIIYASTHGAHQECPQIPAGPEGAYVWPIYPEFELYVSDLEGNVVAQLTDNDYYDAEATVSPNGDMMVFTSTRSGDLELYTMDKDGNINQVTDELGYDGGAFFSPDGSMLIWRASRPNTDEEIEKYTTLLEQHLVEPSDMELFVANADGSNARQITDLGGANWAPFFHPSGEKILFCSNHVTGMFPFNLFMINLDGTGLEQVTFDRAFDSFPMFSPDGKKLVFASNRNNGGTRNTNVFVADWVD
jgi:Tol biopolymer transport system component